MIARQPPVRELGSAALNRLGTTLGLHEGRDKLLEAFDCLTECWGGAPAEQLPYSDVSPDGSPLEFAVALDSQSPSLQFAMEPLGTGSPPTDPHFAMSLMDTLTERYRVRAENWRDLSALLLPPEPYGQHLAMYGAEVDRRGSIRFKVWFYLDVHGKSRRYEVLNETLKTIGLADSRDLFREGFVGDPFLLSLDLVSDGISRVKVYIRHFASGVAELASRLAASEGLTNQRVEELCLMAGSQPSFVSQPAVTYVSLTEQRRGPMSHASLYIPLWTYAPNDSELKTRISGLRSLDKAGVGRYHRVLGDIARRPLSSGTGIHNYVSMRPGVLGARKVYLSPHYHDVNPPVFGIGRAQERSVSSTSGY